MDRLSQARKHLALLKAKYASKIYADAPETAAALSEVISEEDRKRVSFSVYFPALTKMNAGYLLIIERMYIILCRYPLRPRINYRIPPVRRDLHRSGGQVIALYHSPDLLHHPPI